MSGIVGLVSLATKVGHGIMLRNIISRYFNLSDPVDIFILIDHTHRARSWWHLLRWVSLLGYITLRKPFLTDRHSMAKHSCDLCHVQHTSFSKLCRYWPKRRYKSWTVFRIRVSCSSPLVYVLIFLPSTQNTSLLVSGLPYLSASLNTFSFTTEHK